MGIILWIIFGGFAGWLASIIMGTDGQQGIVLNIVVGVIGAALGGFLMSLLGVGGVSGFNIYSFIVAVIGAILLIGAIRLVRGQ